MFLFNFVPEPHEGIVGLPFPTDAPVSLPAPGPLEAWKTLRAIFPEGVEPVGRLYFGKFLEIVMIVDGDIIIYPN